MKLHQNRLDRFSVIAKRLVDDHSAEYFANSTADNYSAFNSHLQALGKQLEDYATEFIENYKIQNEQLRRDVWNTCTKYLDLFAKRNQPGQLNHYI